MTNVAVLRSLVLFIVAGFCEIGGGYLVWLWLREARPVWYGIAGGAILALYGIVATLQESNFARVYATYGGIFIVMSLLWANRVDHYIPDKYDIIGAMIALIGVCVIYYAPRH